VSDGATVWSSSSSGQLATAAAWLDAHFEAFRPEYEQCVRLAAFQSGWRVLDAGCGSGSFLPVLAESVGPGGSLSAVDLALDNVEAARARLAAQPLACPADIQQGSLLALPYPDGHFDELWIANVFMYLTDTDIAAALAEARRVVRPGGVVVVKEGDWRLWNLSSVAPEFYRPIHVVMREHFAGMNGIRSLPFSFRRAGLSDIAQQTVMVERWAPLLDIDHQFIGSSLASFATLADAAALTDDARAFWKAQHDPAAPTAHVNDPELAFVVGQFVVIGHVPA
jgi:arsenite methyltransferase